MCNHQPLLRITQSEPTKHHTLTEKCINDYTNDKRRPTTSDNSSTDPPASTKQHPNGKLQNRNSQWLVEELVGQRRSAPTSNRLDLIQRTTSNTWTAAPQHDSNSDPSTLTTIIANWLKSKSQYKVMSTVPRTRCRSLNQHQNRQTADWTVTPSRPPPHDRVTDQSKVHWPRKLQCKLQIQRTYTVTRKSLCIYMIIQKWSNILTS